MHTRVRILCVATLLLFAPSLRAADVQATPFADQLIDAYAKLQSYCDRGRRLDTSFDSSAHDAGRNTEICVLKDGRYKTTLGDAGDRAGFEVSWRDGKFDHAYTHSNGQPSFDTYVEVASSRMQIPSDVPPLASVVLSWYWLYAPDAATLRTRLSTFEPKPELSTATLAGYETNDAEPAPRMRLWVSRKDGLIRRVSWRDERVGGLEVAEIHVNAALTDTQLNYKVPLTALLRYKAKRDWIAVGVAILVLSFLAGLVYWRMRLRTRASLQATLDSRKKIWKFYRAIWIWTVVPVFAYALFAPTGGDMSGVALLFLRIGWALFYQYVLWLVALFVLARYLVEKRATAAHPNLVTGSPVTQRNRE